MKAIAIRRRRDQLKSMLKENELRHEDTKLTIAHMFCELQARCPHVDIKIHANSRSCEDCGLDEEGDYAAQPNFSRPIPP